MPAIAVDCNSDSKNEKLYRIWLYGRAKKNEIRLNSKEYKFIHVARTRITKEKKIVNGNNSDKNLNQNFKTQSIELDCQNEQVY